MPTRPESVYDPHDGWVSTLGPGVAAEAPTEQVMGDRPEMKRWPIGRRRLGVRGALVLVLALADALYSGCAEYRVYWGDVHGHTKLSDGQGSPEEYFRYARDVARLDFVIVTDHDFGHGPPWRLSQDDWLGVQSAAERFTVNGRFIAVAGYEWTSQPKYWKQYVGAEASEGLFDGPPRYYNHKNVYFPAPVNDIFRAKDADFCTPDQLAAAVRAAGGLIHNCHPTAGPDGCDQWAYAASYSRVIANTEMAGDAGDYEGRRYETWTEQTVREYLNAGGRTGFVGGSDTHVGHPAPRTAVLARGLSRSAVFEALRSRRTYAVSHARVLLDFRIDGHYMGEEIEVAGAPRLSIRVDGTDRVTEVALIRDGVVLRAFQPDRRRVRLEYVDHAFASAGYYYVRVTQADMDRDGNPSRAWSSPIWVQKK